MTMTTSDRSAGSDSDTPHFEPSRVLRLAARATVAYRHVFAASRAAPWLSRPKPVRNWGFDRDLIVAEVRTEAADVVSLKVVSPDGRDLPSWIPGAHLDLILPSGKQRQYSLCGDPDDLSSYRIAVRRIDTGLGGSIEVHDSLRAGTSITVRGPRNAFPLVAADSYLFVAGGIGITPILPMLKRCHDRELPWRLVYLGRSRATMPFLDELARYSRGQVEIRPDDELGPPDIAGIVATASPGSAVYMCGPTPLMTTARRVMREIDPTGSLHTERFSPLPVADGREFEIHLARRGATVSVGPDETALAAIRREVPGVAYSCQQGFCGTCRVRVLAGEVDHRDRILTHNEREDSMLICLSRSAGGSLVVDL
ncbi:PDR/VanB family oxidoreductase [Rhodococcus sp. NM-2]|uniref:PDR/VanB family oxidoreductase n=1 Tax=Rhodococcus TaxID=1827 RepID=UPI00247720F9|nr:PDR/VanB family oxidoreductase [Rhodococcus opacus]MDH6289690.1 ferredoxin-NADP reductase [Rhodococcus opacus]